MARVSLILGGARSGKSARALALACRPRRVFVATAEALDDEMTARIEKHRAERGAEWELVEEPLELCRALNAVPAEAVAVVDCLTLWLSNLMHHGRDPEEEGERLVAALGRTVARVVIVSNEVGLGLVPGDALSRAFRDEQGRLNRRVAEVADHVEFVAAGLPLTLKGAP